MNDSGVRAKFRLHSELWLEDEDKLPVQRGKKVRSLA
jgi:hypothetical protein